MRGGGYENGCNSSAGRFHRGVEPESCIPGVSDSSLAFVIAPVLAGLDKFFNKLTDWSMYLWAPLGRLTGGSGRFMRIVGAIEIVAGLIVAFKPKLGAPIVAIWLLGIIVNLLLLGSYFDIALRDFGLFLAALALSRLTFSFRSSD
jgi:hypothetical protein